MIFDYYTNIDEMPIWNWNEITKTGDLKYLFKKIKLKVKLKHSDIWDNLQDQYINEFGLESSLKKEIKLKNKIAKLRYDYLITKKRFNKTLISVAQNQLNAISTEKGIKFDELKDHLEKYKGFRIDTKTTTVKEWFYTIKNMSNNG